MKLAPRHYRSDEEPEVETISYAAVPHTCSFCGCAGHIAIRCPVRPVSDIARPR
jgi:hypothetical protein